MNGELLLARQVADLRAEINRLKRQSTTPRPVFTLKNRAAADGVTSAASDLSAMLASVPASGAVVEAADGIYHIDQDITVPEHVTLMMRDGGVLDVPTGATLTINGAIEAGRHQIFSGDGVVTGTPKIDAAFPEWFGAAADGDTDDSVAVEKAARFGRRITGASDGRYLLPTTRVQHAAIDIYSRGKVQHYDQDGWSQFPNGSWYGARIPSNTIIEKMHVVLTSDNTDGKLHAIFACGDPTSTERTTNVTIRDCVFEVHEDAQLNPYRTSLAADVDAGGTTWQLESLDRVVIGERIRLDMDDLVPDEMIFTTTVTAIDTGTNTVTVADGPTNYASAGNRVRGPLVTPLSVLIGQSIDGVRFEHNTLHEALTDAFSDKLVGLYLFDCSGVRITGNVCEGVEKLAGLDYCQDVIVANNRQWNCGQLVDLNKWCQDVEVHSNHFDRDAIDPDGDAVVEINGSWRVNVHDNRFLRCTRGVIVNTKGLVYRSWSEAMTQNTDATPEGQADREAHGFHSVWQQIRLHDNHYEWTAKHAIYIGDSWKSYTAERVTAGTCGFDIDIDDVAINCGNFAQYSSLFGVVQAEEGKQMRIRMHIDNPDAIRATVGAGASAGATTVTITDAETLGIVAGQSIRLANTTDDSASVYGVATVAGSTVTLDRALIAGVASGTRAWIGPGNCGGISLHSWMSSDAWQADTDGDGDKETVYAEGATEVSDCEVLSLSGTVRNCANSGLILNQARIVNVDRLKIENCGSANRNRYGSTIFFADERGTRLRGMLEVDNSRELMDDGVTLAVGYGLHVAGSTMDSTTIWPAGTYLLDLFNSSIHGHATYDLYLNDAANAQSLATTRLRDSYIPTTNFNTAPVQALATRNETFSSGPPTSAGAIGVTFPAGSIVWNNAPAIGSSIGWVNVAGGKPGTWAPFGPIYLTGSASWVRGSNLPSGSMQFTTVTVTGAVSGRPVSVGVTGIPSERYMMSAWVSATNTVTVALRNQSGVDLAAATHTVIVYVW